MNQLPSRRYIIGLSVILALAVGVGIFWALSNRDGQFQASEPAGTPPPANCDGPNRARCFETQNNLYQIGESASEELREAVRSR